MHRGVVAGGKTDEVAQARRQPFVPFVEVAESVGGGAVVEVAVRRIPWSMSSRGSRCQESRRGAAGARRRRVSRGRSGVEVVVR